MGLLIQWLKRTTGLHNPTLPGPMYGNMGAILVDVDAVFLAAMDNAAGVVSLFHHQAGLAPFYVLMGKHAAEKAASHE